MNDVVFYAVLAVLAILAIALIAKPKWGCMGTVGAVVVGLVFMTKNGAIMISGLIVLGVVYLFLRIGTSNTSVHIEKVNVEKGSNLTVNVYGGKK